jgi:hypothetical protein
MKMEPYRKWDISSTTAGKARPSNVKNLFFAAIPDLKMFSGTTNWNFSDLAKTFISTIDSQELKKINPKLHYMSNVKNSFVNIYLSPIRITGVATTLHTSQGSVKSEQFLSVIIL